MKLSIIIPFLNQEKYLPQCLDSICNQNFQEYEVILIDDGSTDDSLNIIEKYKANNRRISVHRNLGKGAGAARNLGLKLAKGQVVHFHDSDDWVEPNIYTDLVDELINSEADYVTFCYKKYDNLKNTFENTNLYPISKDKKFLIKKIDWEHIFLKTSVVPWNKLYKRDFISDLFFDEVHVCNDRAFYFRALKKAELVQVSSKFYINYRINNSNSLIGERRGDFFSDIIKTSKNIDDLFSKSSLRNKKIITNTNIEDIVLFYSKCNRLQKEYNYGKIRKYFKSVDVSIFGEEIFEKRWYPNYCAIANSIKSESSSETTTIPIVFATNENYANYMAVAIKSLIENFKNKEKYKLDIFVFHSGLSEGFINSLTIAEEESNIKFINVSGLVAEQMSYVRAHYSQEMYYRLLIPEVLNFYEKVIYLDCDIVVNDDISNLFEVELGSNIFSGVVNFCNDGMKDWIEKGLKLNPKKYINSGILVFNVDEYLNQNIKNKCFNFSNKRNFLACPDQDMINAVAVDKIKLIDTGWNFQWHHAFKKYKISDTNEAWRSDLDNAKNKQYITHFTSGIKPWSHPIYEGSEYFWKYAKKTKYYDDILIKNISNKIDKLLNLG